MSADGVAIFIFYSVAYKVTFMRDEMVSTKMEEVWMEPNLPNVLKVLECNQKNI